MRNWLWRRDDGSFGGEAIYPSGFDPSLNLNDASDDAPQIVKDFRAARIAASPDFVAFIPYDCDCPPEEVYCDCARQQHIHCYWSLSLLEIKLKPTYELVVDGVVVPFVVGEAPEPNTVTTLNREPGADMSVFIRTKADSPEPIPAGTDFILTSPDTASLLPNGQVTVAMGGNGMTAAVAMVAPPKGFLSTLYIRPESDRFGHPQSLRVRSW